MHINIIRIFLIVVLTCLAYWVNAMLNETPKFNQVVSVLIVVIGICLLLGSVFGGFGQITVGP